jgi:plastocyanin
MLGAVVALTLGACGGGGGGTTEATCTPSGTALKIAAQGFQYDKDCLAAPADTAFTIEFDNQDAGTPHNVAILSGGDKLFTGEVFSGKKTETYDVDPLKAGTYEFRCDVHTTMNGSFVVA